MQMVQEIKLTLDTCVASNHHNMNQHRFTKNMGHASTWSHKADACMAAWEQLNDITQQIQTVKAAVKELEAQKKQLWDGTCVSLCQMGVVEKGKVMPEIAHDNIDPEPPLVEMASLTHEIREYTA